MTGASSVAGTLGRGTTPAVGTMPLASTRPLTAYPVHAACWSETALEAVRVLEPAGELVTLKLAVPARVVAVPRTVPLNVKVIVSPFGMLLEVEVTVAVKVTV